MTKAKLSRGLRTFPLLGAALVLIAPVAASAEPWSRQYVVEWLEPAFYHGGTPGNQTGPGTDCPEGTWTRPAWDKVLTTNWRSHEEAKFYLDPENRPLTQRMIRFRGPNYENVWEEPWKAPDLGMPTVSGNIAEGFNLDDNDKTGGFTGKDGVKGVDNGYYKVGGCWASYRGHPFQSQRGIGTNNYMRDGLWTTVVVIAGNQDPMNDDDATFAFYQAQETISKNALSGISPDDTFTVKPTARTQSIFKVKIKDGLIETQAPAEIRLRDEGWNRIQPDQLRLVQGRLRLQMKEDGSLDGMFGGYRDWKVLYRKQAVNGRDTEMIQALDLPSFYHSLARHADHAPDPKTGKNTMISTAYRLRAVPAFVMTPDGTQLVEVPRPFEDPAATKLAGQ